ncbi:MAG: phosphoribosyltransferase [Campylobacteraceae bacterium]|nr:phosphoribosyltransferase [Campylobacteraceae bacterium]
MEKYYYSYDEFREDTQVLADKCRSFNPDVVLGVARGGLTLCHLIAQAYNLRNAFTINSIHYNGTQKLDTFDIFNIPDMSTAKRVLILDDIVDSGETMREIIKVLTAKFPETEFKLATIFYKPSACIQPDYTVKEANKWIDFFWEVDIK